MSATGLTGRRLSQATAILLRWIARCLPLPNIESHFPRRLPSRRAFDARTVESLKVGEALKIKATADGGQEMVFSVSLTGFSSAHDRVVALMQ